MAEETVGVGDDPWRQVIHLLETFPEQWLIEHHSAKHLPTGLEIRNEGLRVHIDKGGPNSAPWLINRKIKKLLFRLAIDAAHRDAIQYALDPEKYQAESVYYPHIKTATADTITLSAEQIRQQQNHMVDAIRYSNTIYGITRNGNDT